MVTSCPGTTKKFFLDLHAGGAHGSEIHKTVEAALRLGPQEISSFKLVYTQSPAISQLPFTFCCHLLAPGAVPTPHEL